MSDITKDHSFGGWFRTFRIKKKITLRQACHYTKLDPGNLSKLERSILEPPRHYWKIHQWGDNLGFSKREKDFLCELAYTFHVGAFRNKFWEKCDPND